jgi:hypothetical protein
MAKAADFLALGRPRAHRRVPANLLSACGYDVRVPQRAVRFRRGIDIRPETICLRGAFLFNMRLRIAKSALAANPNFKFDSYLPDNFKIRTIPKP